MKSIEVISIPVTDQNAAKQFYQTLGFQITMESTFGPDQNWVQLAFPGQETVSITLVTWFPELKPGSIRGFVIKIENMNDAIKELNEKGIEVGGVEQIPGVYMKVSDMLQVT